MKELLTTAVSNFDLAHLAILILALAAYEAIKALARSQDRASTKEFHNRITAALAAFFKTLSGGRSDDNPTA